MQRRLRQMIITILAVFALSAPVGLAANALPNIEHTSDDVVVDERDDVFVDERTDWYRDARFGMFIHFGVYSEFAGQYGSCKAGEWIKRDCNVPWPDYEAKAAAFSPDSFDADAIVAAAKSAGQKYIVVTSKHHDGFAMWDTDVNDWNIHDHSGFERDLMGELKTAAEAEGLKFGVYYSIWDWHDPDAQRNAANPDAYFARMKAQLHELHERYEPSLYWFDGEWEQPWSAARGDDLERYMRELSPSAILNNRIGTRLTSDGDYGTPEQTIPGAPVDGQLWETCMTIPDTWGYSAWDTNYKSAMSLTRNLLNIASNSGNFLLNVGPKPDGTIPVEESDRLREMGDWISANGHDRAVYGNGHTALVSKPSWGFVSRAGDKLYAAVTAWPAAGQALHLATTQPVTVTGARVLGSDQTVEVDGTAQGLDILPAGIATNGVATVIELDIEPVSASPVGTGTGLTAKYWAEPNWAGEPAMTRLDATVNHNWSTLDSPTQGIPARSFSSRWTGKIEPRFTEEYTFIGVGASALRVAIDGEPVTLGGGLTTGRIQLEAGRRYDLWVDQTSSNADAVAKLLWRSPNTPQQIVPSTQLYPAEVAAPDFPAYANDNDPAISYSSGDWYYHAQRGMGDFQNDVHSATRDGASASYSFTGTGVGIVTERNHDQGLLDVFIDGALVETVDTYATSRELQVEVFVKRDLAPGQHDVRIVKRSGQYALLDRIDVYDTPPAALALTATAESRCAGSKALVAVRVRNDDVVPVDVTISTPFGRKTFTGVQPDASAFHAFSVRAGGVAAGTAEVSANGTGDHASTNFEASVGYAAKSCL